MAQTFGERWQIESPLKEGGQGRTFIVRDLKGNPATRYVLKRLKNLKRLDRFRTEVAAIEKLTHPAILTLIDHELDASEPYTVTEYCSGGALPGAVPFWRESPQACLLLFEQLLDGVAHAHSVGVIHRDIKPDNVFLRTPTGPPVLGDFGLAFLEDSEERHTALDEAIGPRLYMAPELEDGRATSVNAASDVYSLGKLLYWLITGRVFSREKHRATDWDLKAIEKDPFTGQGNPFLEHVNELLDYMIVEAPSARRDVENLRILTRQTRQLLSIRAHPLNLKLSHPCSFCGRGTYGVRVDGNPTDVTNLGLSPVSGNTWRILICNNCGHVQFFNVAGVKGWSTRRAT